MDNDITLVSATSILFKDQEHKEFYYNQLTSLKKNDVYHKALVYTVGICPDTRRHWSEFYDEADRCISPEVINKGWQTSGSLNVTRLALQLFTDGTPTAYTYDEQDNEVSDIKECSRYSVSDIFCCEYAPFFVESIKLRYPEYFR